MFIVPAIGWDNGFGDDKIVGPAINKEGEFNDEIKEIAFPSIVTKKNGNNILRTNIFSGGFNLNNLMVETDNMVFYIGNIAVVQDTEGGLRSFEPDKFKNGIEVIKLLAGLALLYPNEEHVYIENLVVGLSLESINNFKSEIERYYSDKTYTFKVPGNKGRMNEKKVEINKCICIPQGVGAFFDKYLTIQNGKVKLSKEADNLKEIIYGLVDIGEKTTDFFVAKGITTVDGSGGVLPKGISDCFDRIGTELGNVPANIIQDVYKAKKERFKYGVFFTREQYMKICDKVFDEIAAEIANELLNKWKREIARIEVILLCGGGASVLKEYIEKYIQGDIELIVIDKPQFANVRGYYKFGIKESSKRRKKTT